MREREMCDSYTHTAKTDEPKLVRSRLSINADFLPPRIYERVPEGRGESEYLQRKYSAMPAFHRKAGEPPPSRRLRALPESIAPPPP